MSNPINQLKLSMLKLIKYSNKKIKKNQLRELIGISQIKRIKIRLQKRYSLSEKTVIIDDQI